MKFNKETIATIKVSTGIKKLTSGTITTPLAYFDLALPAGYVSFLIELTNIFLSTPDAFELSISQNGGTSFINDPTNFDTYSMVGNEVFVPFTAPITLAGGIVGNSDSLVDLVALTVPTQVDGIDFGISSEIRLFPGSASALPSGRSRSTWEKNIGTGAPNLGFTDISFVLNPAATIPPTKARVTTVRFQPYGNGDANPPTSGQTITAGTYVLWGITS